MRGQAVRPSPDIAPLPLVRRGAGGDWLLPALLLLFLCSGVSALVYQVLWLRLLALVFGVTVWAATTVLVSFMAGLALGSYGAGRLADRVRRPLLLFALAEALVGLSALATPPALRLVEGLYAGLYPVLPEGLGALTAVRFALSFAVLIVPTTLMGATLPLVVRSALVREGPFAQRVSLLYATNTAGAVLGAALAGFFLVGAIGIGASFRLAATLNGAVALGALAAGLAQPAAPRHVSGPADRAAAADGARQSLAPRAQLVVLAVFGLSGLTSLAQEIIWFRILAQLQPATTYAFTLMLATFLAGIAVGSYASAALGRWRGDRLALLAGVELGVGVVSLLSLHALGLALAAVPRAERLIGGPLVESLVLLSAASFLAVFPATSLMGLAFPLGMQLWSTAARPGAGIARRVGVFYSLNVLGAILGAPLAGFVLLPTLGSRSSLAIVAALSLLGGLALLALLPGRGVAAAIGLVALALFWRAVASLPEPGAIVLAHRHPGEQQVWREEGIQTTVAVNRAPNGSLLLRLDGWPQASDDPGGVAVHRLIGNLPVWLHPDPRAALVVGLGGGATAGAVAQHRSIAVDVVELSDSVVRGSEFLRHVSLDVLRRPNVRLLVDDGRNHLLLSGRRYDVITADAIWPLHAGAGNLYAAEYFRLVRDALTEDGLALQWIGAHTESQYRLLARTFLSVFPDTTFWHGGTLLVGSRRPLRVSRAAFERRLADPAFQESLRQLGLRDLDGVLALYWTGPEEMARYAGPGPILTDDHPRIEYYRSLPRDEPPPDLRALRADPSRHVVP